MLLSKALRGCRSPQTAADADFGLPHNARRHSVSDSVIKLYNNNNNNNKEETDGQSSIVTLPRVTKTSTSREAKSERLLDRWGVTPSLAQPTPRNRPSRRSCPC